MKTIFVTVLLAIAPMTFGADQPVVLGHLETNRHLVTIYAGNSASYTVRNRDGKVLAEQITARELHTRFPELASINDATTVAWAGL